jgi:hypothetical protein
MKRIHFLVPAAIAGAVAATITVVLKFDAASSYALIGVVGLIIVGSGIALDLKRGLKRRIVVEMHEAAIRTEHYDRPPPGKFLIGISEWNENRVLADNPVCVTASSAGAKTLLFQKFHKGSVVSFSHWADPTQKQLA